MVTRRGFLAAATCSAVAVLCGAEHDHLPKFEDIAAALEAKPGAKIADVGAGDGNYTFKLAPLVGAEGRVWAVDIKDSALRNLKRKAAEKNVTNVEIIEGKPDNPLLPEGQLDSVLIVNAYHEMNAHEAILKHVRQALKPGGRLVIIESVPSESKRTRSRQEQEDSHELDSKFVESDLKAAAFEIVQFKTAEGDSRQERRYMYVARKRST